MGSCKTIFVQNTYLLFKKRTFKMATLITRKQQVLFLKTPSLLSPLVQKISSGEIDTIARHQKDTDGSRNSTNSNVSNSSAESMVKQFFHLRGSFLPKIQNKMDQEPFFVEGGKGT